MRTVAIRIVMLEMKQVISNELGATHPYPVEGVVVKFRVEHLAGGSSVAQETLVPIIQWASVKQDN